MPKPLRDDGLVDGFSPAGGQTRSPYIYGDIALDEGDLSPSVRLSSGNPLEGFRWG
jgi:hypothetical protein